MEKIGVKCIYKIVDLEPLYTQLFAEGPLDRTKESKIREILILCKRDTSAGEIERELRGLRTRNSLHLMIYLDGVYYEPSVRLKPFEHVYAKVILPDIPYLETSGNAISRTGNHPSVQK